MCRGKVTQFVQPTGKATSMIADADYNRVFSVEPNWIKGGGVDSEPTESIRPDSVASETNFRYVA